MKLGESQIDVGTLRFQWLCRDREGRNTLGSSESGKTPEPGHPRIGL